MMQVELILKIKPRQGQIISVEDLWKLMKEDLLASCATCDWASGPPRHRVPWWQNDNTDVAVKEKRSFWKSWKEGGSKEVYLEAKKAAK